MRLTADADGKRSPQRAGTRFLLAIAALLALGVAVADARTTEVREIYVDGAKRSYRLFLPSRPEAVPVPLMIALHGAVQSAAEFEADLGMNRVAEREKFAVVYPEGINRVWEDGRPALMRLGFLVRPGNDVPFLTAIVHELIRAGIADARRVYLTGLSMGGFMAARMACERADLFAAIALIGATVPEHYRTTCAPSRPLPALLMHGTLDPITPWHGLPLGGAGLLPVTETAQFFADLAGCMAYSDGTLPSLDRRSAPVSVRRWSICRDNSTVVLYAIPGGGHLPPSAEPGRGETFVSIFLQERSHTIDAAEEIWRFFRQFRLNGAAQRGISAQ